MIDASKKIRLLEKAGSPKEPSVADIEKTIAPQTVRARNDTRSTKEMLDSYKSNARKYKNVEKGRAIAGNVALGSLVGAFLTRNPTALKVLTGTGIAGLGGSLLSRPYARKKRHDTQQDAKSLAHRALLASKSKAASVEKEAGAFDATMKVIGTGIGSAARGTSAGSKKLLGSLSGSTHRQAVRKAEKAAEDLATAKAQQTGFLGRIGLGPNDKTIKALQAEADDAVIAAGKARAGKYLSRGTVIGGGGALYANSQPKARVPTADQELMLQHKYGSAAQANKKEPVLDRKSLLFLLGGGALGLAGGAGGIKALSAARSGLNSTTAEAANLAGANFRRGLFGMKPKTASAPKATPAELDRITRNIWLQGGA
jgi:hypothetical protein